MSRVESTGIAGRRLSQRHGVGTAILAVLFFAFLALANASAAGPEITRVTVGENGYVIEGRGFGNDRRLVRVYEATRVVDSGTIAALADDRIEVRARLVGPTTLRVAVGRLSSADYAYLPGPLTSTRITTPMFEVGQVAASAEKPAATMTDPELEAWALARKTESKAVGAVLRLMKAASVAGDRAFRVAKKVFRQPDEFMIAQMRTVGYGFDSFASEFIGHVKRGLTEWLLGSLKRAGYSPAETTPGLKDILGLGEWVLITTWRQVGERVERYVPPVVERFGMEAGQLIDGMRQRGFSPAEIWKALQVGFRPTGERVAGWLADRGYSALEIAAAAKSAAGARAVDAARWLRSRFAAAAIGDALVQTFNLGGEAAAAALVAGGVALDKAALWLHGKFSPTTELLVEWLHRAGVSAEEIVKATRGVAATSPVELVRGLRQVDRDAATIARALQRGMNASAANSTAWLLKAGFPADQVAGAIRVVFGVSATSMAQFLAQANVGFQNIVAAIATAFSLSLAEAGQLVISLGIR